MKSAVLFLAFLAISTAHVVPTKAVPGDNRHYVEGENQYIWMSDDPDTEPVLVDLHEPVDTALLNDATRNGANNQYWLFTRQNPTTPQIITFNNANSIWVSNFLASRQTKFVVHGWNGSGNSAMNPLITAAFLNEGDVNVIVVDWNALANTGYLTALSGVPSIGQYLGNFFIWLVAQTGLNWNNIHLVGFSLGAHVVGNAGRTTGSRVRRVTGLDPAGPLWGSRNENTINPSDGVYVEIIHTDSGLLGLTDAVGDADFYPNGGRNPQPGCLISTCSHSRAPELFAATVYHNHLVGRVCGNVDAALSGSCAGATFNMGNGNINKYGLGIYHLTTGNAWPF